MKTIHSRGAQIQVAMTKFVWWHLIFVGFQYAALLVPSILR